MATEIQTTAPTGTGQSKDVADYIHDADLPDLPPAVRTLFEEYSKIPAAEVQPHVLQLVCHISFDFKSVTWSLYIDPPSPRYMPSPGGYTDGGNVFIA